MTISYKTVQQYLDAIALNANLDAGNAGHKVFWHQPYAAFITGFIPTKQCAGQPVPIIDPKDKVNSAFYQILKAGWCGMPQMPKTGPFVTDKDYSVKLGNGETISGDEILQGIRAWLEAGALEDGQVAQTEV
ncbi:hypothetical protein [Mesorhizobium huakuii]|uniref:Uncharacterized protein n=1 Tax=Mesorhizobium huakuii TaxID=28104 RepID=A0A7G6T4D5_9HYPH|nr:hypothetical protein [Mesorhizobium huakuii]QND61617.1 hypothetical protein HB778_35625 [Mesorhizobium huakuii]